MSREGSPIAKATNTSKTLPVAKVQHSEANISPGIVLLGIQGIDLFRRTPCGSLEHIACMNEDRYSAAVTDVMDALKATWRSSVRSSGCVEEGRRTNDQISEAGAQQACD